MKNKKESTVSDIHDFCIDEVNNTIYIHSMFDNEDNGIDFRVSNLFIKNFNILNKKNIKNINIYINNIGGSLEYGMAIYDLIKSSKKHITMYGIGEVCSMASIIMQAGDLRITTKNTTWLLHEGYTTYDGTFKKTKSYLEFLQNSMGMSYDIYAEKMISGKNFKDNTKQEIISFLENIINKKEDWILNGEQAVFYGLADKVL